MSIQHLRQAYHDRVEGFESILQSVSETILEQIDALNRIASEFSHFARMPERQLEPCNIHHVLREAVNLYAQNGHMTITLRLDARFPVVTADREELRRVFINIIRNAVQAVNERGAISILTLSREGVVEVQIGDDGPGIPPEIQSRLFEPNFSTKTDGMGLGLAIVKKIIDDLGGNISIASAPGSGTTVTIHLPVEKESAVSSSGKSKDSRA